MGYFRKNIEQAEGYVPGFQPVEKEIVKLNTNENPYPPSPLALEVLGNITGESLRRYPDPTGAKFRKAAAEVNEVDADWIICGNGGDDIINIAIRAFCDENRALAYPVPTYSLYPVLAKLQNCPVIEIPFDKEFNLPAKLSGTGANLTIVCNPNAPSGSIVNKVELASLADEINGVLLIDEAYVDFAEDNCIELVKSFENVIILRSMSKGYSLAGMRFGYAIANPEIINGLMKLKDSYNVDAVAIEAATAAISDREYFKNNILKIKQERKRVIEQLREKGFLVQDSYANFVFAQITRIPAINIYEKLVQKNIYVRFWDVPGLSDKLRITVGTAEQNNKLLKALDEILSPIEE